MIVCTSNRGRLGFVSINVLSIQNVKIQNCGAAIHVLALTDRIGAPSGPYLPNTSHVSLAMVDSSAVSLSMVTITEYMGMLFWLSMFMECLCCLN